jgi:hypothetical protein
MYRRAREALEQEAVQRLGRPLTTHEQNLFRSCGTLTRLEELGMTVYYAENAEELSHQLADMSFESRFVLAVDELVGRIEGLLRRRVSAAEREQLHHLGNIEALWELEYTIHTADAQIRDKTFTRLLYRQTLQNAGG